MHDRQPSGRSAAALHAYGDRFGSRRATSAAAALFPYGHDKAFTVQPRHSCRAYALEQNRG
jgi:hypothetical protein